MKRIWRLIFFVSLVAAPICLILLLNITAPNPTRRRYSSQAPDQAGTAAERGRSGEDILAADLGLPRNEAPDQRQCICNRSSSPPPSVQECRVCVVSIGLNTATYRRPDFIAPQFIAESKNAEGLYYDGRELGQIMDYAAAANAMNVPLFVYVRVNTDVDPEFDRIVSTTRGAIVRYFTTPGYSDPVDNVAKSGLGVSLCVIGWVWLSGRNRRLMAPDRATSAPKPGPGPKISPRNAFERAADSVDTASQFARKHKDRIGDNPD